LKPAVTADTTCLIHGCRSLPVDADPGDRPDRRCGHRPAARCIRDRRNRYRQTQLLHKHDIIILESQQIAKIKYLCHNNVLK